MANADQARCGVLDQKHPKAVGLVEGWGVMMAMLTAVLAGLVVVMRRWGE